MSIAAVQKSNAKNISMCGHFDLLGLALSWKESLVCVF